MKKQTTGQRHTTLIDSQMLRDSKARLEWLVEEVFVTQQPAVVGGPKKSLKTTFACDLAISLGTGTEFLGHFQVPKARRTAVLSGESGTAVIRETALRICQAKGIPLDRQCGVYWRFDLPRLGDEQHLAELTASLVGKNIEVVIIDPLYLCFVGSDRSFSPSNLYDVGPLLYRASKACLDAGATPILIHHATKGSEKRNSKTIEPPELGDLAFAGVAEFARQWLLLSRAKPYEPGKGRHEIVMSVGGSAGHSGFWHVAVSEGSGGKKLSSRRWQVRVTDYRSYEPMDCNGAPTF